MWKENLQQFCLSGSSDLNGNAKLPVYMPDPVLHRKTELQEVSWSVTVSDYLTTTQFSFELIVFLASPSEV